MGQSNVGAETNHTYTFMPIPGREAVPASFDLDLLPIETNAGTDENRHDCIMR